MITNSINAEKLEKRLLKFEGRHFRLLNRLASKNLKEKISSTSAKENVKKELKKYFTNETPKLVKGVISSLYSKIDGSIKDTRFNNANLGLVIEKNDVKTSYNLEDLKNFASYAGIRNSTAFSNHKLMPKLFGKKIINTTMLKSAETYNSNIAFNIKTQSANIGEHSTNNNTKYGENSINNKTHYGHNSTNNNTYYGEDSTNNNTYYGTNSTNTDTIYGQDSTNNNTYYGANSTNNNTYYGYDSTNNNTDYGPNSTNNNTYYGACSTNNNTNYGYNSTNNKTRYGWNSTNTDTNYGEDSTNTKSHFAINAKLLENCKIGKNITLKDESSICSKAKIRNSEIGPIKEKDSTSTVCKNAQYV